MLKVIPLLSLKSGTLKYKAKPAVRSEKAIGESNLENENCAKNEGSLGVCPTNPVQEVFYDHLQLRSEQKGIGAGGAPEAVRRIIECKPSASKVDPECQLIHEENTSRIYFKIPDEKASKKLGRPVYNVLQCADISAGDLRVTTKFGSWDSMVSRILIECDGPMFLWKQKIGTEKSEEIDYEFVVLSCCMVKATFPVEYISMVCKMMHLVKVSKMREIIHIKDLKRNGSISRETKMPSKIKEGLPEWVNYIPYRWYSANLRRIIEYVLILYTIVSLLWAVWQLYRHVDFIRLYLKPIMAFFEHYFSMLKSLFQWFDDIFTVISFYWWNYVKPLLMILVATFSPIFQIFHPLKGIINIIPHLFSPFVLLFNMICMFVKPVFLPLKSLYGIISLFMVSFFNNIVVQLMENPAIASVMERVKQLYIAQIINEALHGHLDPLKAQVVVIRDLIFKSSRKIYHGVRFIMSRMYFMVIFFKREREYSKEGETLEKENEDKVKSKHE